MLRYQTSQDETSAALGTHSDVVADEVLAVDFAEGEPSWGGAESFTDATIGLTFWIRKA